MPDGQFTMVKPYNSGTPEWGGGEVSPSVGAYYYVFGGSIATYKTCSATIILPSSINLKGTGPGRNGYISFGLRSGDGYGIDIGLQNLGVDQSNPRGAGWRPVCYETFDKGTDARDDMKAPADAVKAFIKITPDLSSKKSIHMDLEWYRSNGASAGSYETDFPLGMTYNNWTNFYRFASMPAKSATATRTDSTYMIGGEFVDAKVGSANWGIGTGQVSKAWIYSHPKCQFPDGYWDTGEQFRIDHWA